MFKEDEESNKRRAGLQSQQLDEKIEIERRIASSNQRQEALIDEFYGPAVESLSIEIDTINTRLNQTGLRGLIHRTIKGSGDREKLQNAQLSFESVLGRMEEIRKVIRSNQFTVTENMALKHDLQRENLEMDIHHSTTKPRRQSVSLSTVSLTDNILVDPGIPKGRSR